MDANKTFNRQKMQWLNAISLECEINSTSFRVAYLIADHFNRVAGFAWPSLARLAERICLSNKSVYRAVRKLEREGWLEVDRKRERSNHYRMAWPAGRRPSPRQSKTKEADENVLAEGQDCTPLEDSDVRQSYLTKLPKTFSSRLGKGSKSKRFSDRGKYEVQIMNRFGAGISEVLQKLDEIAPAAVDELCRMEQQGLLTRADIDAARLAALHHAG
jgi:hypothetical protein